jgi:hypothetical protein
MQVNGIPIAIAVQWILARILYRPDDGSVSEPKHVTSFNIVNYFNKIVVLDGCLISFYLIDIHNGMEHIKKINWLYRVSHYLRNPAVL